ncbi:MAG: hypothetical protein B6U87_01695 [Candidatus Aenigmarchaeota archaeon ex4484_52]|nr:MAG: hypothetical protein B6U87_01695 [Candidatus Aenigmarchaeota archaeon ex4484_52]
MVSEYLNITKEFVMNPIIFVGQNVLATLPGIFGAIIIILLGLLIAKILGNATKKILYKLGLDKYLIEHKLDNAIGMVSASKISGDIVKWYVFVLFLIPAVNVLKLGDISLLIIDFVKWFPSLIFGIVIVICGLLVSEYCSRNLKNTTFKFKNQIALCIKLIILFFFLDVALSEIGLNIVFIENVFLLILGGFIFALSLAMGIGLGFALKEEGKEFFNTIIKEIEKKD